jgi:alpha-beta hydrolase superfamily lysophospholipase
LIRPAITAADAGLADEHWKAFYSPREVDEIVAATTTTMIVSGTYPIHVRLYVKSSEAPTVIMAHPMLPYGLLLARLQLPFFRAGFNVVQWDLPGWGQSGGPRANCPISDFLRTWREAIEFTRQRFHGPRYAMGLAEDSVTCYYVGANNPDLRAISLHTLHQYGDPDGVRWQGPPWLVRLKAVGVGLGARLRPDLAVRAQDALPWRAIFSGPRDDALLEKFGDDPLRVQQFHFVLAGSMMGKLAPPVLFEDCRTPVQVIASEKSRLWPYSMNVRYYERLGGPKELITLEGVDQWVYTREFHELYAGHVIRWFNAHGAGVGA